MENIEIPTDIMIEIFNMRLKEAIELDKQGKITSEETIQLFTDAVILSTKRYEDMYKSFQEVSDICLKYGNKIIEMSKEIRRERRILSLYLTNKDLDWEYSNFEHRILNRILNPKEKHS